MCGVPCRCPLTVTGGCGRVALRASGSEVVDATFILSYEILDKVITIATVAAVLFIG